MVGAFSVHGSDEQIFGVDEQVLGRGHSDWQCDDIGVTITARDPFSIEYDLGGTIWGGSRFTVIKGELFFNGRPCLSQSVGY